MSAGYPRQALAYSDASARSETRLARTPASTHAPACSHQAPLASARHVSHHSSQPSPWVAMLICSSAPALHSSRFPPPTSSLLISMPDFRTSSEFPHRVGADTQASPAQLFSRSQLLVALLGHAQTPHTQPSTRSVCPFHPLRGEGGSASVDRFVPHW